MPIPKAVPDQRSRVTALAAVTLGLGLLALATPLGGAEYPASRIGVLLAIAAAVEVSAFAPTIDRSGATEGYDERGHQHGDRALPDQRSVCRGAGATAGDRRLVCG